MCVTWQKTNRYLELCTVLDKEVNQYKIGILPFDSETSNHD